ncbi:MAG: DegV family protein [Oscillospiraceae bacterium]|nr:DegV family protein [Oscillospiraceae bacterium]
MNQFVITTDNGSDLGVDLTKEFGVELVNLTVIIDEEEYDGANKFISSEKIYNLMKKGKTPKTSQVSPAKAEEFFESYLKKGLDVLHLCLSGQVSGSYNSCKIAEVNLKQKYPERKIEVIDSLSGSLGQGLLVLEAIKQKNQNKSFEEIIEFINNNKKNICHIFTVDDLTYLKRSGRISRTKSAIGSFIGVKPILSVDNYGRIVQIDKVRGRKNSILYILEKIKKHIDFNLSNTLAITHADCQKDAEFIRDEIKNKIDTQDKIKNIIIENMGPVLGSHSGPGTLAVFFLADQRLE